MRYAIIIAFVMVPTVLLGQWYGWPSSNYPTMWAWETNNFDGQCYSGDVERAQLVGVAWIDLVETNAFYGAITNVPGAGFTNRIALTNYIVTTNFFGDGYEYTYTDPMGGTSITTTVYLPWTAQRAFTIDRNIKMLAAGASPYFWLDPEQAAGTTNFDAYFAGGTQALPRLTFASLCLSQGIGTNFVGLGYFTSQPETTQPLLFMESTWNGVSWSSPKTGGALLVGPDEYIPSMLNNYATIHYITNGPIAIPGVWVGLEGRIHVADSVGNQGVAHPLAVGTNLVTGIYTPTTQHWVRVFDNDKSVLRVTGSGGNTGDVVAVVYTNAYTIYGGGRHGGSYDIGWQELMYAELMDERKAAIDALWITEGVGTTWTNDNDLAVNQYTYYGTSAVSWAAAQAMAATNTTPGTNYGPPQVWTMGTYDAATTQWVATAHASQCKMFQPVTNVSINCEVDFYGKAGTQTADTKTFDANGSLLLDGVYAMLSSNNLSVTGADVTSAVAIGQTNLPNWCPEPSDGDSQSQGFVAVAPPLAAQRWEPLWKD